MCVHNNPLFCTRFCKRPYYVTELEQLSTKVNPSFSSLSPFLSPLSLPLFLLLSLSLQCLMELGECACVIQVNQALTAEVQITVLYQERIRTGD